MLLAPHIYILPMPPKPSMAEAPWLIIPNEFNTVDLPYFSIMGLREGFN
jgi:hypothetical protein